MKVALPVLAVGMTLALFLGDAAGAAESLTIFTAPAGDGYLNALQTAKTMDKAVSTPLDSDKNESHSLLVGKIWNGQYKTILEFQLPEGVKTVKKARLRLSVLGNSGGYPGPDGRLPEVIAFYYAAPEADGAVSLGDDLPGKRLATPIFKAGDTLTQQQPGFADVTEAAQAVMGQGSIWIGFRLEAPDADKAAWRFVSAENQFNNNNLYTPALLLEVE